MTPPDQNTPEALRAYMHGVDRLEHGTARVAAAEVAVSRADELGDEDLRYKAREILMTAAVFSGRPDLATVHFGWMLARFDADPARHSEAMLLWQYKWIVTRLPLFPQIPKAQILATFADMEARFRRYGQGEHALQKIRRTLCQNLGDDRGAAKAHRAFLTTRRDTLSDCAACVPSSNVYYYIGVNDDEKAFAEAAPILDGDLRCASVPHSTIAGLLLAYLRNGRGEEAMALHRRGYKLVERNPEHVDDAAKHMLFLALTGNHAAAIRLFERHAPVAAAGKDPMNGFYFNLRAHLTLILLLETGRDTLKLRLRPDFSVAGDKGVYGTKALITWYLETMTNTAKLFDARNENGAYMKLVRAFRRNKKHATPVPVRKG